VIGRHPNHAYNDSDETKRDLLILPMVESGRSGENHDQ